MHATVVVSISPFCKLSKMLQSSSSKGSTNHSKMQALPWASRNILDNSEGKAWWYSFPNACHWSTLQTRSLVWLVSPFSSQSPFYTHRVLYHLKRLKYFDPTSCTTARQIFLPQSEDLHRFQANLEANIWGSKWKGDGWLTNTPISAKVLLMRLYFGFLQTKGIPQRDGS